MVVPLSDPIDINSLRNPIRTQLLQPALTKLDYTKLVAPDNCASPNRLQSAMKGVPLINHLCVALLLVVIALFVILNFTSALLSVAYSVAIGIAYLLSVL